MACIFKDCEWSFLYSLFAFWKESWTKLSKIRKVMTKPLGIQYGRLIIVIKSETHKTSVLKMQSFVSVMNNEIKPIN